MHSLWASSRGTVRGLAFLQRRISSSSAGFRKVNKSNKQTNKQTKQPTSQVVCCISRANSSLAGISRKHAVTALARLRLTMKNLSVGAHFRSEFSSVRSCLGTFIASLADGISRGVNCSDVFSVDTCTASGSYAFSSSCDRLVG